MVEYLVEGDRIVEKVDGRITSSFGRDCAESVKAQLFQKDTTGEIMKFFSAQKPEPSITKDEPVQEKEVKSNASKRGKKRSRR